MAENWKTKLADLKQQQATINREMKELFFSELKSINAGDEEFNFDRFDVYVNNHEFNDGDETTFSVHYESLVFLRGGVEFSEDVEGEEQERIYNKAQKAFSEVFTKFEDADDMFFERIFEDAWETVEVKLK